MNTYLSAPALTMQLVGQFKTGGVLELYVDTRLFACIKLSPAAFSVATKLFLKAIHTQSMHWFNAYVPTTELIQVLKDEDVLPIAVPDRIHKLINKIRSELVKTGVGKLIVDPKRSDKERAASLIQSLKGPGYRIALPPASLKLFIGETQFGG